MTTLSTSPDIAELAIPMDTWSKPFWEAAQERRLVIPRCGACATWRWPPGPFCPVCQSQSVELVESGKGRIYSFTVVHDAEDLHIPALVEFSDAGGVRLLAAIVDARAEAPTIGASVSVDWVQAANTLVPIFRLAD